MPLRATVTSTYEVGGPSTATPVGHPLTTMTSEVATQPQDGWAVRSIDCRHFDFGNEASPIGLNAHNSL
ncbi:hypothetical protein Tco_1369665 [Tanacetum coccineum]